MSTKEAQMDKVRRAARMARIIERLERLDDTTLSEVDRITSQALLGGRRNRTGTTSRREFLKAAAAGGAIVAATGGLAAWQLGYGRLVAVKAEAEALRQLVGLYEQMEGVGLDDQMSTALETMEAMIADLNEAAASLRPGLSDGRTNLLDFQSRFPSLQTAFQWLEQTAASLSQRLLALENSVNDLLEVAAPLTETIGGFMRWLLDRLPYSAAERVREGLERTGETISILPDLLEGLYSRILEPMRDWFSPRSTAGLNGWLVNPLLSDVLDPAEALVEQFDQLAAAWEERLDRTRQALEQRQEIRTQIQRLRETCGL